MSDTANLADLERVRKIRFFAEGVVAEMQSAERPSVESSGIAFVLAESIVEIADDWERDLLSAPVDF